MSEHSVTDSQFDLAVIGSGPAGQKAAIQAAKLGKHVALIEKDNVLGGACVHRGTIPSKTLRENALRIRSLRQNTLLSDFKLREDVEMTSLITRLDNVLHAHDLYMRQQIDRNHIQRFHGRARFLNPRCLEVENVRGHISRIHAPRIIIASGSFPRHPPNIPINHESIFDSDSILSMLYLPKTLTVLGGGVIASEYASIFQALGVAVTMIDKYERPLGFLDRDLTDAFVHTFTRMGGTWIGNTDVERVRWDGFSQVEIQCRDGRTFHSEKLLCAAGREANTKDLCLENAGLALNDRKVLDVDEQLQTRVPGIYAAGDVIGPPSLASASMEQGRRASCNALGLPTGSISNTIPAGIYGIPELSAVGLSEEAATRQYGRVLVGKAHFTEIARSHISGIEDGMLKLVCDAEGRKILGVMIVGEGATELIHIGQMAMQANADVDIFVESIFNFPTLAEAYRVAALAVIGQRQHNNCAY